MNGRMTVGALCGKPGMGRQNYCKARRQRQRKGADGGLTGQPVPAERASRPRLGGRKLLCRLGPEPAEAGVPVGRDRFSGVLREKSLLPGPLKGEPKTTNSRHSLPVFRNPVKDTGGPNQAWAADIAYIRTGEGFPYLSLLTDMRSRKQPAVMPGIRLGPRERVGRWRRHWRRCRKGRAPSAIRTGAVSTVRVCMSRNSGRGAAGQHDRRNALL
jgi:hypothetical protein